MNIKLSRITGYKVILFLCFVSLSVTGCKAKCHKLQKTQKIEMNDSIVKKAYGDSIYTILFYSKITSMLITNDTTGTKYDSPKRLSHEDSHLLRFLITSPTTVGDDALVYGIVIPCIRFEFRRSSKEFVYINLDFGLRKWTLEDSTGKVALQYNLGNSDLLRFCHYLYPQNEIITQQYNAIEK